jgi:glycosyltransferase involved in cell wall biosynthesis
MSATYGFLSTHPPTQCGLATFNAALAAQLTAGAAGSGVVRLSDGTDGDTATGPVRSTLPVVHTWRTDRPNGWRAAAAALNRFDVAVFQHEYGIYPGLDGQDVLPVLRNVTVPTMVVLHTVLTTPSPRQQAVLEQIVSAADAVVTMTDTARTRLTTGYRVDPRKVHVIPHGAVSHTSAPADREDRPHLLTWGLLGPGKGIEWALRSLAHLKDLDPPPMYTIAGRTHPKVLESSGDAYRDGLHQLAADLGVSDDVRHLDSYLDQASLSRLIRSADVVVLPYDSTEQVTSGVLIEAVGAGIPVVATEFPHAVELLADGPGLLVPHQDPQALADAVRRVLTEPALAARLSAGTDGPTLRWPAVAARYAAVAAKLLAERTPAVATVPA